jgi:ribulose bisphosphate carboxylase small subunit
MAYYISPRFLNKVAVHITKNFLSLPQVRMPLILGIHGRKGEGKTFQCELIFDRMGIEVVHITAGELESPDAGDPARLIRLRYREAAELVRVRGKMAALMINDLDAGAGRFDSSTQYTVNTQLVNGTLMNIADNPTNVQLPGSYDDKPIQRIPILVTGNDFSTLYAPLIRDGRMEKFYWEPDRSDRIGIVGGIFSEDGLSTSEVEKLVEAFPGQSIDFFGALRSRIYDAQIEAFIAKVGIDRVSHAVVNSKTPPQFQTPDFSLGRLLEQGALMVGEQDRIQRMRLSREYNESLGRGEHHSSAAQEQAKFAPAPPTFQSPEPAPTPDHPAPPLYTPDLHGSSATNGASTNGAAHLSPDSVDQVRNLMAQGLRVNVEWADERRFRVNSWQNSTTIQANDSQGAIAQLEDYLSDHPRDYVRLVGIDPHLKKRVGETIIHRPKR